MKKLPISAIVVSCEEAHLLKDCLLSLGFCKEIIVIDLESRDETQEVATSLSTKLMIHPRVPIVEQLRSWCMKQTKFDWVLFLDPDERINLDLQLSLIKQFESIDRTIGSIDCPWQFFFRDYPLQGTVWGGKKYKRILVHKDRIEVSPLVHQPFRLKEGYETLLIGHEKGQLNHLWGESWVQLFHKHQRYLKEEGKAQFLQGKKYSFRAHLWETIKAFYFCFFTRKGYRDQLPYRQCP